MSDPLAHVYDLARDALAEQERQVGELRGRLTPVLAASGLAATLLTPLAFRGAHPTGVAETLCALLGLLGMGIVLVGALHVLLPRRLTFGATAESAMGFLASHAIGDERAFYAAMVVALDEQRAVNLSRILALHVAITVMLGGMLLEVCGLAAAAALA